MTNPRVAHVVRRYGGVTEPFIEQRLSATPEPRELWSERLDASPANVAVRLARPLGITAGSIGDRLFHRFPAIGPMLARPYRALEASSRPDVVHAHYLTTAYLVADQLRCPLVASAYGFDVTVMPRRRAWQRALGTVIGVARAILVEGPFMRQTVVDLGFAPDAVRVVPIAAGLDRLPFRAPIPDRRGARLISCGRMVEKKGHDVAVRAFGQARSELPAGAELHLVGLGPEEPRLRGLVRELGLTDRVTFHGSLARPAYLDLLATADLLVAASVTARNGDAEGGAPTTILDAQATGVISLGSTHCDIPFLIRDTETGYLAAEGSVDALARVMQRAFDDRARWPSMASAARRQVEERHSDAHVARLLAEIHEEAAR